MLGYVERFKRTYRQEVLNCFVFETLGEVPWMTTEWLVRYNEQRPNKSLGDVSPPQYLMAKSPLNPLLPSGPQKRGGYKGLDFSLSRRHSITLFHMCCRVQGIRDPAQAAIATNQLSTRSFTSGAVRS